MQGNDYKFQVTLKSFGQNADSSLLTGLLFNRHNRKEGMDGKEIGEQGISSIMFHKVLQYQNIETFNASGQPSPLSVYIKLNFLSNCYWGNKEIHGKKT